MRRTKLAAAVLVTAGLLFGASGTAMAVGGESKPQTTPVASRPSGTPAETTEAPTASTATTASPATTQDSRRKPVEDPTPRTGKEQAPEARPARPVPGEPSFTG